MVEVPINADEFYLGHELYLRRPHELLLVDASNGQLKYSHPDQWSRLGIRVVNPELLEVAEKSYYGQEIALHIGEGAEKRRMGSKTFPLRWVEISENIDEIGANIDADPEAFILSVWQKWVRAYLRRKSVDTLPQVLMRLDRPGDAEAIVAVSPDNLALFDLHGDALEMPVGIDPERLFYYEAVRSNSPTGNLIRHFPGQPPARQQRLLAELIEAVSTHILILDERIQKKAANRQSYLGAQHGNFIDQLRWMKIFIPSRTELDLLKARQQKEEVGSWIRERLQSAAVDFLIIHLGTIEKIVGTGNEAIERFIVEEIRSHNARTEVVITTGRGKPHYISESTLFLHYSNIARFVVEEPSKYHLCKILFASRTRFPPNE